jgi:LruC domain-containing protein
MKTNNTAVMKLKSLVYLIFTGIALQFSSCDKSNETLSPEGSGIRNMNVSDDFKYSNTSEIAVSVSTLDNNGNAVPNIRVTLYTDKPENGGAALRSFVTGNDGTYSSVIKVPAGTDSLVVSTNAIGFVNLQKVDVSNGSMYCVFGGKPEVYTKKGSQGVVFLEGSSVYKALGSYNGQGVPNYLEPVNDLVDASLIADINATLPEQKPLTSSHPAYFNDNNEGNIVLKSASNVWVTFIHEGAGYKNTLGFYKYKSGNKPVTAQDIDTIYVIFPNVSFAGSGGGLVSGNKVNLGIFPGGTEIGWVLIANGYNGTSINDGYGRYFSDIEYNPEAKTSFKKHSILLNDIGREKFLLSFEDLNREGTSDNDFNDAVFQVTANPISAVDITNIPLPNYTSKDSDGDGVSDNFDDYPDDPERAFDNYYPSKGNFGTLAFEDNWPIEGDYDFNDLVVAYNFNQVTNGQNNIVEIRASFTLKASGAGYHDGFGIQLPVDYAQVSSVKGTDPGNSSIKLNKNGTESGQTQATIIVFDDAYRVFNYTEGPGIGINTSPGAPYIKPVTLDVDINFVSPVNMSTFDTPPYNPFLIVNKFRKKEVHLTGFAPTDLADMSYFGTQDDASDPSKGKYYETVKNLPWAIDIPVEFDYPAERVMITNAHLKFFEWGNSEGMSYYDWYKPLAGYREDSRIFKY